MKLHGGTLSSDKLNSKSWLLLKTLWSMRTRAFILLKLLINLFTTLFALKK